MAPRFVIAQLEAKPGKETQLKDLLKEAAEQTKKEDGTQTYNIFTNGKGTFYVYEIYRSDADAAIHSKGMKKFGAGFAECLGAPPKINLVDYVSSKEALEIPNPEISVGDRLPNATFHLVNKEGGISSISSAEIFDGKRVVLFSVPGPFTPNCTKSHLPGFIRAAEEIKAKKVDSIVCVSVADAFVLDAWKKAENVGDNIKMLADGNGSFTKAVGLTLDMSQMGLGLRSKRYALIVEDGLVKEKLVDYDRKVNVSSAASVLSKL